MSNCNNFSITSANCEATVGGLLSIELIPFGSIFDYTYDNDNPNKITGYNVAAIPATIPVGKESYFQSTVDEKNFKDIFNHELSFFIPKISKENRAFFEALLNNDLSIIMNTRDGKSWLLGKEAPVRVQSYDKSSGSSSIDNGYNVVIAGSSTYEIREIERFTGCFAGISTREERRSFWVFNIAGYTFDTFEVIGNDDIFQYSPLTPLDPLNWTDPVIYNRDLTELNNFFSNIGTSAVEALVYDSDTNTILLSVISLTTTFDFLAIGGQNPLRSTIKIDLILNTILGTGIPLSTNLTITDGTNTLASGAYTDNVSAFGLGGTVGNLTITVTDLYPNSSPTFDVVIDASLSCPTSTLTYTYDNVRDCTITVDTSVHPGKKYQVEVPILEGYGYRTTQFYFNGNLVSLYPTITDYHNSFTQLEADLTAAIIASNWNIDTTTITVTQLPKSYVLSFYAYDTESILTGYTFGNDPSGPYLSSGISGQSNVVAFQTLSPPDSFLTIEDVPTGDVVQGQYDNTPVFTDFELEDVDNVTTGNIESIGISWNAIEEDDETNVSYDSSLCPNTTESLFVTTCYDNFTRTQLGNLYRIVIPQEAGGINGFALETSNGVESNLSIPTVNGFVNLDLLCNWVNSIAGITVVNFFYSPDEYVLTLITDAGVTFDWFATSTSGAIAPVFATDVSEFNLTPYLHPNIQVAWSVSTLIGNQNYQGKCKDPLNNYESVSQSLTRITLDIGADDLFVEEISSSPLLGDVTVGVYQAVPSPVSPPMVTYTVANTASANFNVVTDVVNAGFQASDINYIVISYNNVIQVLDGVQDGQLVVYATDRLNPLTRGRFYKFLNFGNYNTAIAVPTVTSINCGAWSPAQLANLELWLRPESLSFSFSALLINATVVQGSPDVTVNAGQFFSNQLIHFGDPNNNYRIVSGAGLNLTLDRPVTEASGSYVVSVAYTNIWPDSSPFNRTVLPAFNNKPIFKDSVLNGYPASYLTKEAFFDITPVTRTNLTDQQVFTVLRVNQNDNAEFVFCHADGTVNNLGFTRYQANGRVNTGATVATPQFTQASSDVGLGAPDFDIAFHSIKNVGGQRIVRAGINGQLAPGQGIGGNTLPINSSVQRIGTRNNGVVELDGFAGDIVEFILVSDLSETDRQIVEGYLAWKYGLEAQLPPTHPYANVAP